MIKNIIYLEASSGNNYFTFFLQARPSDYARNYLASQEPVSFHKFWMIDPLEVYDQWFSDADSTLESKWRHTEL